MTDLASKAKLKSASCSVIVTRADGTVEDHGVVAYYHRNPLRRLLHGIRNSGKRGHIDVGR